METGHKLKGISVWEGEDSEEFYANGLLKEDSKIEFQGVNFDPMDGDEEFEETVSYLCVHDDEIKYLVIEEETKY